MMSRTWAVVAVAVVAGDVAADPQSEQRGRALYQAAKFAEAAVELEIAYVADPSPSIGFALAQSLRLAGNCPRAMVYYRTVLEQVPAAARANVLEAMAPCEAAANTARAEAASAPPARDRAGARPGERASAAAWYGDLLGGVLVGCGVVGLGTGLYGFSVARGHFDDASAATTDRAFGEADADGDRWNRYAIAGTAVGAALIVGGLVRYTLVARDASTPAVTIEPSARGATVTATLRW